MNKSKENINKFLKNNEGSSYIHPYSPKESTPEDIAQSELIILQERQAEMWRLQGYNLAYKINSKAHRGEPHYCWDYENLIKDDPKMLIIEIGGDDRFLKVLKESTDKPDLELKKLKPIDLDTAQVEFKLKKNFNELKGLKDAGYYYEAEKKQRLIDARQRRISFNHSRKALLENETVSQAKNYVEKQNELIKFFQDQIKKTESSIKEVEKFLKIYDTPEKEKERLNLRMAFSSNK